jgi:hypothetical protein
MEAAKKTMLSLDDVKIMLSIFNIISQRGLFLPNEFVVIGNFYTKISQYEKEDGDSNGDGDGDCNGDGNGNGNGNSNVDNIEFSSNDIKLLLSMIDIISKRNGFLPIDFKVVGNLYEKLSSFNLG